MCVCVVEAIWLCKTSVRAALNLRWYTYEVWSSFQVDLTEPILSRFDVLCVVRDTVDPVEVGGSTLVCTLPIKYTVYRR